MKSKISIIIAAFAILISFAFITVNKNAHNNSDQTTVEKKAEPMQGFALEDEDQWK